MANYQHILVAIDFSHETDKVFNKALEVAASQEAKVSLIHVVEYSPYLFPPDTPLPIDLDLEAQFVENARQRLQNLTESKALPEAGRFVEVGSPTTEIVRVAQEQEADLIVMGSHGRHGLQRVLGSTASGVLHTTACDVLAVRIKSE
ncbi:MAG: universal stress protein [Candidatus Thiodiazotropha sp.]|jgi:universal stress protein A